MKPSWSVVAVAALLGAVAGATLVWAFAGDGWVPRVRRDDGLRRDGPEAAGDAVGDGAIGGVADGEGWRPLPPSEDPSFRPGPHRDPRPRVPAGTAVPGTPEAEAEAADAAAKAAERRRREMADRAQLPDGAEIARRLADSRAIRDRDGFARALRSAAESPDVAAHDALAALMSDAEFSFPDGHDAVRIGTAKALLVSKSPALGAAAKTRYLRDRERPGDSWDAHGWLALVAAHGAESDVAWIESQYDGAPRPGQITESLGFARDDLAAAAIRRAMNATPPRDGWREALERLAARSPAAAFPLLDEAVAAAVASHARDDGGEDFDDLSRLWVKTAGTENRPRVLERIAAAHDLPTQVLFVRAVQALTGADGKPPVSPGIADVISSPGRALRTLASAHPEPVAGLSASAATYAIEYNRVAWTAENVAAMEHAATVLTDSAEHLRAVIAIVRRDADWK